MHTSSLICNASFSNNSRILYRLSHWAMQKWS